MKRELTISMTKLKQMAGLGYKPMSEIGIRVRDNGTEQILHGNAEIVFLYEHPVTADEETREALRKHKEHLRNRLRYL